MYLNMGDLKVVSLNVKGINITGDKRYAMFKRLKDKNYDICLIQETYCTDSLFVSKFTRGWSGETFHCRTDSVHSRGVKHMR